MTEIINKQRFIEIDGVEVAVTEEVYREYKRPAWVERKRRQVRAKNELSLEEFMADGHDIITQSKSLETAIEEKLLIEILKKALKFLSSEEYDLIHSLFYNRVTVRDYADKIGTNHTKVIRERNRILKKLKKYF